MEDGKIEYNFPRLQTTAMYWRWRNTDSWNGLPVELGQTQKISVFKTKLKKLLIESRRKKTDVLMTAG